MHNLLSTDTAMASIKATYARVAEEPHLMWIFFTCGYSFYCLWAWVYTYAALDREWPITTIFQLVCIFVFGYFYGWIYDK